MALVQKIGQVTLSNPVKPDWGTVCADGGETPRNG